eukprot:11169981-Lingulodinium_polyedra.AAC.1
MWQLLPAFALAAAVCGAPAAALSAAAAGPCLRHGARCKGKDRRVAPGAGACAAVGTPRLAGRPVA